MYFSIRFLTTLKIFGANNQYRIIIMTKIQQRLHYVNFHQFNNEICSYLISYSVISKIGQMIINNLLFINE